MRLIDRRIAFTSDLGLLINFARGCNFDIVIDQVLRTSRESTWNATHCRVRNADGVRCERERAAHGDESWKIAHEFKPIGIAMSLHNQGLAADIYIIKDGKISDDEQLYSLLGTFWKELRHANAWGGDFSGFKDLGHFSHEYNGRK